MKFMSTRAIKYDQNLSYRHWQKELSHGPALHKGRKSLCILNSACFATHVSIQTRLHHICIVYIYIYIHIYYCCFYFQAAMSKASVKLSQGSWSSILFLDDVKSKSPIDFLQNEHLVQQTLELGPTMKSGWCGVYLKWDRIPTYSNHLFFAFSRGVN